MKPGYLFYWCGWGLIVLGFVWIGLGLFTNEAPIAVVIGRTIFSFLCGTAFIRIGSQRIARARQGQGQTRGQTTRQIDVNFEQVTAFLKENCAGCRYFDENVVTKKGIALIGLSMKMPSILEEDEKWCLRPEPPERDSQYCYSREQKQ